MSKYDLAVVIPSRQEEFAAKTVENILENKRGKTEIIIVLDGAWATPPIKSHPDLTIIYLPEAIGQRAATNLGVRMSKARYIMKIDSHSAVSEGFDVELIKAGDELGSNVVQIPTLYNLHAFSWKCLTCNREWYQGAKPEYCCSDSDGKVKNENCNGRQFEKIVVWKPRLHKKSEFYRFDHDLHFQYHGNRKKHPEAVGDIVETMSAQGSCFFLSREKYWEWDICDEKHGSWGAQGTEVACKAWLSGGRLVTNRKCWYSHMFRTQPGFGFPYEIKGSDQEKAREYSRNMWFNNAWPKQIYPLSWLLEKFEWPEDWSKPEGKEVRDMVIRKGEEFYKKNSKVTATSTSMTEEKIGRPLTLSPDYLSKGIIYYTDNQIPFKFAHNVRKHILKANIPIVSASLKPMPNFGKNIHMKMDRGYEAYFRQILAALEASTADIIYLCEHDYLYHPSHFDFIPPRNDTFFYNWNWYRVRSSDGLAVKYDTQLLPGLVAYRHLLLDHYRSLVKYLEKVGFTAENANKVGFEPGTSKRIDLGSKGKVERFDSEYPIIDIRHGKNLTASKWKQSDFRSQKNCQNWVETTASKIPGWHFKDDDFLNSF